MATRPRAPDYAIAAGLLAGAAGTAVLSVFERLEWAILGRIGVYAAAEVGDSLARRWLPARRGAGHAGVGHALRWVYGPCLGILFAGIRRNLPRESLAAGLCFGAGIFAFEVAAMPAVRATPPFGAWSRAERWLLVLHTAVFGVTTAQVADRLGRDTRADALGASPRGD